MLLLFSNFVLANKLFISVLIASKSVNQYVITRASMSIFVGFEHAAMSTTKRGERRGRNIAETAQTVSWKMSGNEKERKGEVRKASSLPPRSDTVREKALFFLLFAYKKCKLQWDERINSGPS